MASKALHTILFILVMLLPGVGTAADSPTVHDIYLAAQAGKLDQAQAMVEQVLAQHPKSGKAHYVAAEIYVKEGKLAQARQELQTAEQLEPGLPFAKPQAVANLKQQIAGVTHTALVAKAAAPGQSTGFPWGLFLLLLAAIAIIALVVRAMMARNAPQVIPAYPNASMGGQPYGGGYAPMAPQGGSGLGSSIVGGLATGAALGAGMVAGEALAHHFIDGDRQEPNLSPLPQESWTSASNDMGGQDFGITDNTSWDDSSGLADLSGSDDWS